jgi:hypothetical protein
MIKEGSKWGSPEGKEFIVIHVIEKEGHIWVHYRDNSKNELREYSCYEESFLIRFRPIAE